MVVVVNVGTDRHALSQRRKSWRIGESQPVYGVGPAQQLPVEFYFSTFYYSLKVLAYFMEMSNNSEK